MFSGEMDSHSAFLDIQSGHRRPGAQDWAAMLLRMYLRFCAARASRPRSSISALGGAHPPRRAPNPTRLITLGLAATTSRWPWREPDPDSVLLTSPWTDGAADVSALVALMRDVLASPGR